MAKYGGVNNEEIAQLSPNERRRTLEKCKNEQWIMLADDVYDVILY